MSRSGISRFVLVAMAALAPTPLLAQAGFRPTYDRVSVEARFGGLSGAANLNDAGTADGRLGWATSVDATYWLHRYVGIRASGAWGQDSIRGTAPGVIGRGKVDKFFYDGELVLRYPARAGSGTIIPYVLGGAGAVSVHQLGSDSTWTKFAATSGRAWNTVSGASVCGRKAATSSTSSTVTASTRPNTTSSGTAA